MTIENCYTTGALFGQGWKQVEEWPQAGPSRLRGATENNGQGDAAVPAEEEDEDEYEEEEEELYVMIDLGPNADPLTLGIGTEYQLIGLDTPTPFLKIGNDVFQGTPQRLIGSEIITKDTRDPQNPIKHSHPAIGHTDYRISLEPVKLVPLPTDPAPEKSTERPPLFARDAPSEIATAAVSKSQRGTPGATSAENDEEETASPDASTSSLPARPAGTVPSSKKKPAVATRTTPLSTRYVIPASGEISADGIPRIDGQQVRHVRKPRKSKKAAAAEDEADTGAMDVDRPEGAGEDAVAAPSTLSSVAGLSTLPSAAGPSTLPSTAGPSTLRGNTHIVSAQDTRPPDLQRLFMPVAPHGYTKRGVPKRAPGRRPGPRKTTVDGSPIQQTNTLPEGSRTQGSSTRDQAEPPIETSANSATATATATAADEGMNVMDQVVTASVDEVVTAPVESMAMEVDSGISENVAAPAEAGVTEVAAQWPPEPSADQVK